MTNLAIGLAAFDQRAIRHWELLLSRSGDAAYRVLVRYCYGDENPDQAVLPLPSATQRVWLVDVPLPALLSQAVRCWLQALDAPAVLVCTNRQMAGQLLHEGTALRLVSHPQTLLSLAPLPALLALAAQSTLSEGPLFLGLEPLTRRRR